LVVASKEGVGGHRLTAALLGVRPAVQSPSLGRLTAAKLHHHIRKRRARKTFDLLRFWFVASAHAHRSPGRTTHYVCAPACE